MMRFLATDLDGTLLSTQKTITPYSVKVLLEAQERGLTIILASGRPLYSILPFARQLNLQKHHGFIIAFNGSLVWDCSAEVFIKDESIPLSLLPELKKAVGTDFRIHGYKGNSIVVQGKPDEWSDYLARANKMPLLQTDDFLATITEPQHKCIITGAPRKLWHLERRLNKHFETTLEAYRSENFLLEVVPRGVNKAVALHAILTKLRGKRDELLCCGDGYNDLSMMRLAAVSCATGNAKRLVKQSATFITDSNDRDGVAHAVERFVLSSAQVQHN